MSLKRERLFKQAKQLLADPIGREVVGAQLGVDIGWHDDLKDKAIVAVMTPAYRGLAQRMMDARGRMVAYSKQFCKIITPPIMGSSVVSWVRNDLQARLFLSRQKFTHVLWVDDDMVFKEDALVRMLEHDKPVVGSVYTVRSDPPKPNVHLMNKATCEARRVLSFDQDGVTVDEQGVMHAKNEADTLTAGTGLLLVKREVIEAVGEMYINCEYERMLWGLTPEQIAPIARYRREMVEKTKNGHWFKLLDRLVGFGESGEDTSFCLKAALCGFEVVVDTKVQPQHIGDYAYSFSDFLPFQEEEIKKAKKLGLYF